MATNNAPHELANGFFGGLQPAGDKGTDHLFGVGAPVPLQPVDLSRYFPSATNQAQTGTCGPHALTKIRHVLVNKWREDTGQPLLDPDTETFSELWEYYWTRRNMGTFPQDSGSDNRALCQAMLDHHGILESDAPWDADTAPEDIQRDLSGLQPASAPYYPIAGYARVGTAGMDLISSIYTVMSRGYPVVLGFPVFSNFFQADSEGHTPMPAGSFEGGHDVPLGIIIPDASVPGGGWGGWDVSWLGFGVEHYVDGVLMPGRWSFMPLGALTSALSRRYFPPEAWWIA